MTTHNFRSVTITTTDTVVSGYETTVVSRSVRRAVREAKARLFDAMRHEMPPGYARRILNGDIGTITITVS
jgi:hypothetical protein